MPEGVLVMVALQFRDLAFSRILHMIPRAPAFWAVFATYYLTPPFIEWLIYRRLWGLPFSGLAALLIGVCAAHFGRAGSLEPGIATAAVQNARYELSNRSISASWSAEDGKLRHFAVTDKLHHTDLAIRC